MSYLVRNPEVHSCPVALAVRWPGGLPGLLWYEEEEENPVDLSRENSRDRV